MYVFDIEQLDIFDFFRQNCRSILVQKVWKILWKCRGLKIQIWFPTGFWAIGKNLWKLEFVVLRIDWWILWTSYYVDLKVIQISREITEVRKFKCDFLRKILAPLWIPYIIGDWIAAFFNSFCQNLPCGTNQDQSLCSRTWLNANDCLLTALLNAL